MSEHPDQDEEATADSSELEGGEGRVALPTWNRSRRKRKANVNAEDAEDGFQRGVRQAGEGALKKPQIMLVAIVGALVAIGLGSYLYNHDDEEAAAQTQQLAQLAAVESRGIIDAQYVADNKTSAKREPPSPVFESALAQSEAMNRLLEDSKQLSSEEIGLLRELMAGAQALRENHLEGASQHYNAFLAGAKDTHPLRFMGLEGQAFALEASGDLEAALKIFESLSPKEGDFYRDMSLWQQGRLLEALGRKDDAIAVYTGYLKEFQKEGNLGQAQVRERLTELDPEALNSFNKNSPLEIMDQASAGSILPPTP